MNIGDVFHFVVPPIGRPIVFPTRGAAVAHLDSIRELQERCQLVRVGVLSIEPGSREARDAMPTLRDGSVEVEEFAGLVGEEQDG